jgi:hypothetical protein
MQSKQNIYLVDVNVLIKFLFPKDLPANSQY